MSSFGYEFNKNSVFNLGHPSHKPMSSTKEQIIESATRRLYQMGYNRFSFAHVSKDCEITKASIHYHFPTKDKLVLAAIDRYITATKTQFGALRTNTDLNSIEKFNAIFDLAYTQMIDMNYLGCLAGNLGLEVSETNEVIHQRIQDFFNYKLALFVELIDQGKLGGLFNKDVNAIIISQSILSSLEGGMVTTKISKSPDLLEAALNVCRNIINKEIVV